MKQKGLILLLAVAMLFVCMTPAMATIMATELNGSSCATITVCFNEKINRTIFNATEFEAAKVKKFFEDNDMNYDYYKNWLYAHKMDGLRSVTITVMDFNAEKTLASVNSEIKANRLVYADQIYHHTERENQFTVGKLMKDVVSEAITLVIGKYSNVLSSLASVFGITDPDTYFGTDRVRVGKDYYVNDGSNRVVTKFVELLAPISGKTQWYAWGYAESDYVRHGVQLFYKGVPAEPKKDLYHQYYTENYYDESNLIKLVKEAYLRGCDYGEVADKDAAIRCGYNLYNRKITAVKYLEYDNKVVN